MTETGLPFSFDPQPSENEIECARCGALIYDQLSRCPNCGVNLYEPEDESDLDRIPRTETAQPGWILKLFSFFRRLFNKPYTAEEVFGDSLDQAYYYTDLLKKVGGDPEVVERLIGFEKNLHPSGTRVHWLKNAIQRWEQDNRTSLHAD